MTPALLAGVLILFVSHVPVRALSTPAVAEAPDSANLTFGFLRSLSAKPDETDWKTRVRTAGLQPWIGHEGWWHRKAADGEVRALASFNKDETVVFLLFFPAKETPLTEATLSWLYRTAAGYAFDNADEVELSFAEEALAGGGRRQQYFKLSLTSGTLTRTAVTMRWE